MTVTRSYQTLVSARLLASIASVAATLFYTVPSSARAAQAAQGGGTPAPPPTRRANVVYEIGGLKIVDPYRWLENGWEGEVIQWVAAQNDYFRATLAPHAQTRDAIENELKQLYHVSTEALPQIRGGRYFVWKRSGLQNQPVYYYRAGSIIGEDVVALDPNVLSRDGTVSIDWAFPTPDGRKIAYGVSSIDSTTSRVQLRDLASGMDHSTEIRVSRHTCPYHRGGQGADLQADRTRQYHLVWEPDARGYLYTGHADDRPAAAAATDKPAGPLDEAQAQAGTSRDRAYERQVVYYHRTGSTAAQDQRVFDPGLAGAELELADSADGFYTLISVARGASQNDVYFRANPSEKAYEPLVVGQPARFTADVVQDTAYILTDLDAPRGRLMKASLFDTPLEEWEEIVPQGGRVLRDFIIVGGQLVLHHADSSDSSLSVHDLDGRRLGEVAVPRGGVIRGLTGAWDGHELYFEFESLTQPPANFRYDLTTRSLVKYWSQDAPSDAGGGVAIPVSYGSPGGASATLWVMHRPGFKRDGQAPLLLRARGAADPYGPPRFDPALAPWLERGGVVAVADVRGDLSGGRDWHEAGILANRSRAVEDLAAAAETLIREGYTSPKRLAVGGDGLEGLPALALVVKRPELFRAAVFDRPPADLVRYAELAGAHSSASEWASLAGLPAAAKWLHDLSPYAQVREGATYPATLLLADPADDAVGAHHARKLAARLQAVSGSDRPILVYTQLRTGRGTSKPLPVLIRETADKWTFLMVELGMIEPPASPKADG